MSRAWSRGVRSLLYAGVVLLVDDDDAHVRERRDDGQPRPDDDVDLAAPDTAPLVGALAVAEARVDERDPRIEVGPEPIDERQGERDLGHEHERGTPRGEGRTDRLDVDRGLATARHAVQEQGARIPLLDRPRDAFHGGGLRLGQLGRPRPTAARPGRSRGQRPARPFPHASLGEAAPNQGGEGRRPVPPGHVGRRDAIRRYGRTRQLRERVDLARTQGTTRLPLPRRQRARGGTTGGQQSDPAFVAGPGARPEQRPVERHEVARRQTPKPAEQAGPAIGRCEVTCGPRSAPELVEEVGVDGIELPVDRLRGPLGDQLEAFQQARRQHRPDHEGRWRQVVLGDPARQCERQGRQERSVGTDTVDQGLGRRSRRRLVRAAQHDPERLPPAELDQHGLAILEIRQGLRHAVGEGPRATGAGRVDRDLDQPPRLRPGLGGRHAGGVPRR